MPYGISKVNERESARLSAAYRAGLASVETLAIAYANMLRCSPTWERDHIISRAAYVPAVVQHPVFRAAL